MMSKRILNFPNELGWEGRERDFKRFQNVYGDGNATYSIFKFTEKRIFEKEHSELNTKKEYIYVCKGNLKRLLEDLKIYDFSKNEVLEGNANILQLNLVQMSFSDSIFRQPKKRTLEGRFYQVTEEEFEQIPFESDPITSRRDRFLFTKIYDSVESNDTLNHHFSIHLIPLKTNSESNCQSKYRPIIKESTKRVVPDRVNQRALELAKQHDLNEIEFNFLNFLYETRKALRNGEGQSYFDIHHNGPGWYDNRSWVKRKMQRLMDLGLVKYEIRHDCRDARYTSWYFYDSHKNLDHILFLDR